MKTTISNRVEAYINDRNEITDEQRKAILSPARLTVVRACPGSGKTRMFAARAAYEIANWERSRRGVAALSFTNVAWQEVVRRMNELGVPAGYPHFIGTIDSFLLRYIVRRFGQQFLNLRLFTNPIEDDSNGVQSIRYRYGTNQDELSPLAKFRLEVVGDQVSVYVKGRFDSSWVGVQDPYATEVKKAKKKAWSESGQATYSDICFLALWLLRQPSISGIVATRFPIILIDEFQDTGGLREACIHFLAQNKNFQRGFFVGDPDQCIMEFAGARADLFSDFERIGGAISLSLINCFRSHSGITNIATCLQREGKEFKAQNSRDSISRVLLATHKFKPKQQDLSDVVIAFDRFIAEEPPGESGCIAQIELRENRP